MQFHIKNFSPFRDQVFEKKSSCAFGAKGSCVAIILKIFSALRAEKRRKGGDHFEVVICFSVFFILGACSLERIKSKRFENF